MSEPRIGVALGAGAARGWAHIGVLERLAELGVVPDVVAGCSSGAFIGAFAADDRLALLRETAADMSWLRTFRMLDWRLGDGGLIQGSHVIELLDAKLGRRHIEELAKPFACVATELATGRERWLTRGELGPNVLASMAVPGFVAPQRLDGRRLVDGALTNPVPVSLVRALGADVVIAVALGGELALELETPADAAPGPDAATAPRNSAHGVQPSSQIDADELTYFEIVSQAMIVVQNFVTRIRLAAEPADLVLTPAVSEVALHDFHRAEEAIAVGRGAVDAAADEVAALVRAARPSRASAPDRSAPE